MPPFLAAGRTTAEPVDMEKFDGTDMEPTPLIKSALTNLALNVKEREPIGRADQVWNKETRRFDYHKTKESKGRNQRFNRYAVFVRRIISEKGLLAEVKVDIKGLRLQEFLRSIHQDTDDFAFDEDPPVITPRLLFHSYDRLQERLKLEHEKASPDADLLFELNAAVSYIKADFEGVFASIANLRLENSITFNTMWTLFPPNTIAHGLDELGYPRAVCVRSCYESKDPRTGIWYYVLEAEYLDYDGTHCGTVKQTFKYPAFEGSRYVCDLPFYPLDCHPEASEIRATLLKTGRRAMKYHGRHLVQYEGAALREPPQDRYRRRYSDDEEYDDDKKRKVVKYNPHGRVMLDPAVYKRTEPNNKVMNTVKRIGDRELTEEEVMMLKTVLYGFSLGDKIWGAFSVNQVEEVRWNDETFEALVLESEQKEFIRDLVQAHKGTEGTDFDDYVRDKGKGLIGLLSGSPGVGKTLTAEAIAEVTRRPLYMVSSGDFGQYVYEIQSMLEETLERAELWNAVVLLDEADVYLAERSDLRLDKNAVTAIFLRELEYYQGILIMTTNRITSIDQAFQSRIHFTLQYPDLDDDSRRAIWTTFMGKAQKRKGLEMAITKDGFEQLVDLKLNGRQIKNAMSVSQAVAVQRGKPLTVESIRTAIKLSQNF